MGGRANENYRTNLFLENSAYTFEWNLDFTADEKSYCFQGNKHSEVTDCSWLKKKKKKSPRLQGQKLMPSPLMPLEWCRGAGMC